MTFQTQSGHWRFAAARYPDAVHFNFDPTFLPDDDYNWIYSYEVIAVDMIIAARKAGAPGAILIHSDPVLAPGTISLRTIVRDIMRDECATRHLHVAGCIECDDAFIAALRPPATLRCARKLAFCRAAASSQKQPFPLSRRKADVGLPKPVENGRL